MNDASPFLRSIRTPSGSSTGFSPQSLARLDMNRMRNYREMLDFYSGIHWQGTPRKRERRLTFNYAKVFVDKVTSYLMSSIDFAVDPVEDTPETMAKDQARERARRAEEAIYRVYDENNLEELDFETEIDLPSWEMPAIR